MTQDGARWPQDAEDCPKMALDSAQNAPRWPPDGPKVAQVVPRGRQNGGKMAQDIPKTIQDGSNMAQNRDKMGPRWPQDGTRLPQDGQRWLKEPFWDHFGTILERFWVQFLIHVETNLAPKKEKH